MPARPAKQVKILSLEETKEVVEGILNINEAATLEYMSGYFFRRLKNFHRNDCTICQAHGFSVADTSEKPAGMIPGNFVYLKRYCTKEATLYQCQNHFTSYIKSLIQIAVRCIDDYMDESGIINLATQTGLQNLCNVPVFCTEQLRERLVRTVARTIILSHMKWKNVDRKTNKKCVKRKRAQSKATRKLQKLMHQ